jgi:putative glutamine amidotransferase
MNLYKGRHTGVKIPRIAIPEIGQNVRNYTRAVSSAGMEPIVISVQSEQIHQNYQQEYMDYQDFHVEAYDGLLIPGGVDVNPSRYGQENHGSIMIMDQLDELQLTMLDAFVKAGKPVLGICRGHQVINVYFGGSLIQHLPTSYRHSRGFDEPDKVHGCIAEPDSWLAGLYGTEFFHNSAHHQAVDLQGEGLVIDSHASEDGVVEGMHHRTLPVYSVQWHPERMCLEHERTDTVNGLPVIQFFSHLCGGEPEKFAQSAAPEIMTDRMGL